MKSKLTFLLVPVVAAALQLVPVVFAQPPDKPNRQFQMDRRPRWAGETETGAQGIPRSDAARTLESGPVRPAHSGKNARRSTRPGLNAGICLGESRLPACSCRQPAGNIRGTRIDLRAN